MKKNETLLWGLLQAVEKEEEAGQDCNIYWEVRTTLMGEGRLR